MAFLQKSADDLRPSEFLALGYDPKCVFEGFGEPREGATGDEVKS